MRNYGFVRIGACSPEVRPGDIERNVDRILSSARELKSTGVTVCVFPELSVTGYTCADLFDQDLLTEKSIEGLFKICDDLRDERFAAIIGLPLTHQGVRYNCAAVVCGGRVCGVVPKIHLPNYGEFYEKRWFTSGTDTTGEIRIECDRSGRSVTVPFGTDLIFNIGDLKFGIEICEDLWVPSPPSSRLSMAGADVIFNLSATNELIGKHAYLLDLIRNQSARCRCGYAYASAGAGESSTDVAYAGNCIIAENGVILAESERFKMCGKHVIADVDIESLRNDRRHFSTFHDDKPHQPLREIDCGIEAVGDEITYPEYRMVDPHPFLDSDPERLAARCEEISSIQAWGLAIRLRAIGCDKAVLGISGGLDSTLALLVTTKSFDMLGLDRKGIIGITMPGFGTTGRTRNNATRLMEQLGVTQVQIGIADSVMRHFKDIGQNPENHDVTYENSQARERTQILMDIANKENAIVIGTGDLSELALGWCTYNGDQMSMYGVNASIPKTLVKYLVRGYAEEAGKNGEGCIAGILHDIIDTPISPELLPPSGSGTISQKTEDLVGPYELHDFFLYHILRHGSDPRKILRLAEKAFAGTYDRTTILKWLKTFYGRFFSQQFKRSCMPDGIKAGSVCLSPRGDWRMPSDATAALWLSQLEGCSGHE